MLIHKQFRKHLNLFFTNIKNLHLNLKKFSNCLISIKFLNTFVYDISKPPVKNEIEKYDMVIC